MSRKLAVFVGFIGKLPYAGMTLYNLHYMAGLLDLGYEIFYVEKHNYADECYDPSTDTMTSEPSYAVRYLKELLPRYGISSDRFSCIDIHNKCHGSEWSVVREAIDDADFVVNLGSLSWFEELGRCSQRVFIECDPMFTQVEMIESASKMSLVDHYNTLFTSGMRIGKPGCTIPDAGRKWIPAPTVVATRLWEDAPVPKERLPVTALFHWAAGSDVVCEGQVYGHKRREFERFIGLPTRTTQPFTLAIGGAAPRELLENQGWRLESPLEATGTIESYRRFIANSRADFGVAKHAYVASRSGWFSDRSTCYLASGRPVLHQDTGFEEWLPTGEGVLKFSDVDDVLQCLRELDLDYARHCRAARRIAEEHFEATVVLSRMLSAAGVV